MVETVYRKTYGMFVRPNTSDDLVCDEAQDYKDLFIDAKPYDVFIDVGANIGSVINLAKRINPHITTIGYEPDQENFDILNINVKDFYNTSIVKNALGDGEQEIDFFHSLSSNKGKHSTISRRYNKDVSFKVQQLDFEKEIKENNCTLLKIDIEGGEYNLNLSEIPETIKGLAIEFHLINDNYVEMLMLYCIIKNQFGLVLGDAPEEASTDYFKETYKNDDSFMCIFLRNTI